MSSESEKYEALAKEKKENLFKGTIAVSVIYGCLALGLLIVAMLNNNIKESFQTSLMPFLMTMIIGIIAVIGLLLAFLFAYKPGGGPEAPFLPSDCPDYWIKSDKTTSTKNLIETSAFLRKTNKYNTYGPFIPPSNKDVATTDPNRTPDLPDGIYDDMIAISFQNPTGGEAYVLYPEWVNVKPDTKYTFSAYMCVNSGAANGNVELWVYNGYWMNKMQNISNSWTRVKHQFTTGDDVTKILPRFDLNTSGATLYVTGMQLEEGDDATEFAVKFDAKDKKRKVMCKPNPDINLNISTASAALDSKSASKLKEYHKRLGFSGDSNQISCTKVYPLLFAEAEKKAYPDEIHPNGLRCEYARACGISWSSVCPNTSADLE